METPKLERYLNSFANTVVRQSKESLASSKGSTRLGASIRSEVIMEANGYSIKFYMLDYGEYLDKGVSGNKVMRSYKNYNLVNQTSPYKYTNKQPPPDILSRWIKKKGIKPKGLGRGRDKNTGQFISNLAFLIGKKIKARGIPSLSFFSQPLGVNYTKLKEELLTDFTEDVKTYLTTFYRP
tara:strand:+ start:209 stop:751 length:543 start_codon:yes stop_codon:yes gene_type:complete